MTVNNVKDALPTPPPQAALQKEEAPKGSDGRVEGFLGGKIEAPNEYVAHLVRTAHSIRGEIVAGQSNLRQIEQAAREAEQGLLRKQGEMDRVIADIRVWDK